MGFVILAIYFRLKTTIFNVKNVKTEWHLKKRSILERYYFFIIGYINL